MLLKDNGMKPVKKNVKRNNRVLGDANEKRE